MIIKKFVCDECGIESEPFELIDPEPIGQVVQHFKDPDGWIIAGTMPMPEHCDRCGNDYHHAMGQIIDTDIERSICEGHYCSQKCYNQRAERIEKFWKENTRHEPLGGK